MSPNHVSALRVGAAFHSSPDVEDSGGWRPIATAPRDGTIVELRNGYGVAPSYCLARWSNELRLDDGTTCRVGESRWSHVDNPNVSSEEGHWLTWRPYDGDAASYVDPTGGLQNGDEYWRGAVARKYGLPVDYFEAAVRARTAGGDVRPDIWSWLRGWFRR